MFADTQNLHSCYHGSVVEMSCMTLLLQTLTGSKYKERYSGDDKIGVEMDPTVFADKVP